MVATSDNNWPVVIPIAPKQQSGSVETSSAVQDARSSMLLSTAIGDFLTAVGQNYGVPRAPQLNPNDDTIYRAVIPTLAWSAKTIKRTTYALLTAIFGSQATIQTAGNRAWQIYEVNANEVVFEIPTGLMASSNENASYLHGWYGYALNSGTSASNTFTTQGNVTTASATSLVGNAIYFNTSSGVWTADTISSISYSAVTGLTTIQSGSANTPSGGCRFFIDIAGDNTQSYRGDYVAPGYFIGAFASVTGSGTTNTINVVGDQTQRMGQTSGYSFQINYQPDPTDGVYTVTTTSAPSYSATTNTTTVNITPAIPKSVTGIIQRQEEVADTSTTPPHNDRVYLGGYGLYDVFLFYYNLLQRAAGIVVRLEIVSSYTFTHRHIP